MRSSTKSCWRRCLAGGGVALLLGLGPGGRPATAATPELLSRRTVPPAVPRTGSGASLGATFSADGRYVVFLSAASDLIGGEARDHGWTVYRRDLQGSRTELVGPLSPMPAAESPDAPSVSAEGERITFTAPSGSAGAGGVAAEPQVWVRRMNQTVAELVSRRAGDAAPGNGASGGAVISENGRYVVFESRATDLVSGVDTNQATDVFLRDLEAGETLLLSVRPGEGASGSGASRDPLVSAAGDVVVFRTAAEDLAPADGAATDLVVWRREPGRLERLVLPGVESPGGVVRVSNVVLSRGGEVVAFRALGPTEAPGAADGVWRFNLAEATASRVSPGREGTGVLGADDFTGPVMSADGGTLAFETVEIVDGGTNRIIRVWTPSAGTRRLSELANGAAEPQRSGVPRLNGSGSHLAFVTPETPPGATQAASGDLHLAVRELSSGQTRWIAGPDAVGWDLPEAVFHPDGGRLLFQSPAVLGGAVSDSNRAFDVFLASAEGSSIEPLSVAAEAAVVSTPRDAAWFSPAGVSADGRYVLYGGGRGEPEPGGESREILLLDRQTSVRRSVSRPDGGPGTTGMQLPAGLSADGRFALWLSAATHPVAGDTNGVEDLFQTDLDRGVVQLVNARHTDGGFSHRPISGAPEQSADGRWVAFISAGRDLVTNTAASGNNLYLRDTVEKQTHWVNQDQLAAGIRDIQGRIRLFALGASGQTVAFTAGASTPAAVYLYDHRQRSVRRAGAPASLAIALSEARQRLAGVARSAAGVLIYQVELETGTRTDLVTLPVGSSVRSLAYAADGDALVFVTDAQVPAGLTGVTDDRAFRDVFLLNLGTSQLRLCSVTPQGTLGSSHADLASVSGDGRWVAFRAGVPPAGEVGGIHQILVHDVTAGRTTVVSTTSQGTPGNGPATLPSLSRDGRTLVFLSSASDLAPGDVNGMADVFAVALAAGPSEDSDGDGLPDSWEREHFGDLRQDGAGDPDDDGAANRAEYEAGTHPADPQSRLWLQVDAQPLALRWRSVAGIRYQLERRGVAVGDSFQSSGAEITGDGSDQVLPVGGEAADASLYRLRVRR